MKLHSFRIFVICKVCCLLFIGSTASAQDLDSLDKVISGLLNNKNISRKSATSAFIRDSLEVKGYIEKGWDYESSNPDSSIILFRKALDKSLKIKSLSLISRSVQKIGSHYLYLDRWQEAMSYYLTSLKIEESLQNENRLADLYNSLGSVYRDMNVFNKALDYFRKSKVIYEKYNDTLGLANAISNMGSLYSTRFYAETRSREETLSDCDTALFYNRQAADLYMLLGDSLRVADLHHGYAFIYNRMGRFQDALPSIQLALDYYRRVNNPERVANALFFLGILYRSLKEYDMSIQTIQEAATMMTDHNLTSGIQYLYEEMADTYYRAGKYKQAYESYTKYMTLEATATNDANSKEIFELETKYQTKVKENEILSLTAKKRRRDNLVIVLTGAILLLTIAGYNYIRIIKTNKIIADQKVQISEAKIQELEKEKSYLAARAVMEGEEAERARLASDLHNGLGGLLSGIKINLSSMKENAVISHENVSAFNHAISLLDTSISELRRIAHNLMPETLNHYGLKTALEDFCAQVSPAGSPEIVHQFFGDEIRYTKEIELTMYRIIQELVNNALKHADAKQINIQLFSEPKRLYAQVTDNGKGFDYKSVEKERRGKGLENISERLTALNGNLEVWSEPGQGTEISVEIEIT